MRGEEWVRLRACWCVRAGILPSHLWMEMTLVLRVSGMIDQQLLLCQLSQ